MIFWLYGLVWDSIEGKNIFLAKEKINQDFKGKFPKILMIF